MRDTVPKGFAPIDAFGIGTRLGTSEDAPNLDLVYKLAQLDGRPLLKLSTDKSTLPGLKQIWRRYGADGLMAGDVIGLDGEDVEGTPLLLPQMRAGRRVSPQREPLETVRQRAAAQLAALPTALRSLEPADPPYPIEISPALRACTERLTEELQG